MKIDRRDVSIPLLFEGKTIIGILARMVAPDDDSLTILRGNIRNIFQDAFSSAAADLRTMIGTVTTFKLSAYESAELFEKHSAALEKAAFENTAGCRERRYEYAILAKSLASLLRRPIGPHPDDLAALRILRGELTVTTAIEMAPVPVSPDPRDIIRRMFAATLMRAAMQYCTDRVWVLADARAIEQSCFNAVVRSSKQSEDPPRRQWDAPAFVDMYSAKCGKINVLLDPVSSACTAYGATIVPRLLDGTLRASEIGDATSCELCPDATASERAEIANRLNQKVKEKVSNLFKCPYCGAREAVYREVHTRGLDEMPDYFCRCVSCKCRFKGYN